ncbi:hypothetical protein OROGR_008247 [Orobanche gracilis]
MDERLKEADRTVLEGMPQSPPRRKAYSYSGQLTSTTGHLKRQENHPRNHSLDEINILTDISGEKKNAYYEGNVNSSDDDDFYHYANTTSGGVSNHLVDYHHLSQDMGDGGKLDEFKRLPRQPLPEFMGTGGGVGVYKVPARAAVQPSRPPCLELRPHPLRETQGGKFVRTIASTETQLWAGQESGVRVWNYSDAYEAGIGTGSGRKIPRGDEDAAPFYKSANTSPTMCLMIDQGSKLVWSGHKDGRIRSWKIDQSFSDGTDFKEGFSWQAHRGPVISMTISFYG